MHLFDNELSEHDNMDCFDEEVIVSRSFCFLKKHRRDNMTNDNFKNFSQKKCW